MTDRRSFVAAALAAGVLPALPTLARASDPRRDATPGFPRHDLALVQEVVSQAHRSLPDVQALVDRQPELSKASWDWGFGDWESPLGAAAHTGQRDIAKYLLTMGARPTLFSAAMLGQLNVVRSFIEAQPGSQAIRGPHGISLMRHARAGGEAAAEVVAYLEQVGGADPASGAVPLAAEEQNALAGRYAYGPAEGDALVVEVENGSLWVRHGSAARRGLTHLGERVFHPAGAPSVRIRLASDGTMTVAFGGATVAATRA